MKDRRRFLSALTILIFLFSSSVTAFAQEERPSTPTEIKNARGAQFQAGWNYFTLENNHCTVKQILDELQADGGGALMAESLWVMEGEDWRKYELAEATQSATLVDPNKTYAFFSNIDFFFDLSTNACLQEDPQREQQILGLRAVQDKELAAKRSLLEKITALPFEFWQNFWDLVMGKEETKDVLLPSDAQITLEGLQVLGETQLAQTTVGGSLVVGLLAFDDLEGSINSLGPSLKLQSLASGEIEMVGGQVVIDQEGNLVVKGSLEVGSPENPMGITLYDEETGQPYCLKIKGGKIINIPGRCSQR